MGDKDSLLHKAFSTNAEHTKEEVLDILFYAK